MTNLDELLSMTDMEAVHKLISEGFTIKDIYKIGRMVGKNEAFLTFNEPTNDDNRLNGDELDTEANEYGSGDEQAEEVNIQE